MCARTTSDPTVSPRTTYMRRVLRAGWARCPEKEPVQKHGHNKLATRRYLHSVYEYCAHFDCVDVAVSPCSP